MNSIYQRSTWLPLLHHPLFPSYFLLTARQYQPKFLFHSCCCSGFMYTVFQHNKCNHRDYQNIGVNGARTSSMAPNNGSGVIEALQRNLTDNPAIVFYALIGNDVCSGHQDFDHMSTPEEFNTAVTSALQYLDKYLAPGSHVVFSPLADGELLFSIMGQEIHPVGASCTPLAFIFTCLRAFLDMFAHVFIFDHPCLSYIVHRVI
jgi:hypothetical protein